jgi:virginiamycin A acetyltransferase
MLTKRCFRTLARLEGGDFVSQSCRRLLWEDYGVSVGLYSYGACLIPGCFPRGVKVGRYVSVAHTVRVTLQNKPTDRLAMHPYFYEVQHNGGIESGIKYDVDLVIDHDAWLGDGALITPGCRRIGIGAVVGAGAVVTKDVPDFAVVVGNPAKILRYRFSEDLQKRILQTRWWELSPGQVLQLGLPITESLRVEHFEKMGGGTRGERVGNVDA